MDKDQEELYRKNLPPELFEVWKYFQENRRRMLDYPEYSMGDVLEVTGLTKAQLLNWLSRNLVVLSTEHNPGHGRRRLYTGRDVLMICVAQKLSEIGLPIILVQNLSKSVAQRAEQLTTASGGLRGYTIVLYPVEDKWECVAGYDSGPQKLDVSNVGEILVVLQIDQLIDRVFSELAEMKGRYFASGTADELRNAADEIEKKEKAANAPRPS